MGRLKPNVGMFFRWYSTNFYIIHHSIQNCQKGVFCLFFVYEAFILQTFLMFFLCVPYIRRVWRCQRRNQNPHISEGQTTQWSKEKVQKWVSEWCLTPNDHFSSFIMASTSWIRRDDNDVHLILDQRSQLDCYCGSSLKQKSTGRHVPSLRYIFLISSHSVFSLNAAYIAEMLQIPIYSFWFDHTGLEPPIYCTMGEHDNNYTTYTLWPFYKGKCGQCAAWHNPNIMLSENSVYQR
jgi:hypothetical protein